MKLLHKACFALALLLATSTAAYSQDSTSGNEKFAAGIQLGNQTTGFSFKYRATEKITGQVTLDFTGSITNYGVRGLYAFNTGPFYEIYGYASVALFRFDAILFTESTVGFGGGAGIEYDLRGLSPDLPPLFASFEIGASLGSFDAFSGFSLLGTGIALHYRF